MTWYLKVVPGVRTHFWARKNEWIMSSWMVVWGMNMILKPGDDFETASGVWDGLAYWFGADWVFCSIMVAAGMAGLLALTVNGTFHDTVYSRYSPLVRALSAFVGCGLWFMVWLSTLASSSQGAVAYWVPTLFEALITYKAIGEFGDVMGIRHRGRKSTAD